MIEFLMVLIRFCKLSLLVVSLLVLATGYPIAGGGLRFVITCLEPPSRQPTVIPEGDQSMCIGASFYVRPERKAFINITWIKIGSTANDETIRWLCNDVKIDFNGGRAETVTENGRTFISQYSVNYPDIYVMRESGVKITEILVVTNVSKALSEGKYKAEIILDKIVFTSATSKLVVVPPAAPVSDCVQAPVDVCFVIDGSGSLSQTGFNEEREFVVSIVNQLTSNSNRYCYAIFDTNIRRRILFFLTDGRDSSGVRSLNSISTSLARKDVETFAIGFGNGAYIDRDQLRAIGLNGILVFPNLQEATEKISRVTSFICEACICSSSNTNCGQFTRNTMSQACGNNVAVDFILIVDDTSSMDRQQDWLRTYIPVLEEALMQRCIGNSINYPNLYQIVAYGSNPSIGPGNNGVCDYANAEAPHFVRGCEGLCCQLSPPIPNPTFPISGLQSATANLQNLGGFSLTGNTNVAYAALEFALDNAVLRTTTRDATVIPVTILLTNGDADDYTDARFDSLLDRFVNYRPSMVLAFALNLGSFTTTNNLLSPFGAANNYEDSDLTVWHLPSDTVPATRVSVPYRSASSDVSSSVTPNNEFRNVDRDFIDLLMCSKRSSSSFWDLDFVVNGGAADVTRFTDAFIRQNSDAIINRAQRFNCRLCYCTLSATEVCVFVENEQIYECLQDNPSSDCSCVNTRLQEIARAGQSLTLSPAQVNTILTDCGLIQTPTPSSINCRDYINSVY